MDNVRLFITQSRVSTVRRDEPAVGYGGRRNLGTPSVENPELTNIVPFKARNWAEYRHACFANCLFLVFFSLS